MNVSGPNETSFELVRVPIPSFDKQEEYSSYALYTHPNGAKQWRRCKILSKVSNGDFYKIEFLHDLDEKQPGKYPYLFAREDILLSFAYKRSQDTYYQSEVKQFLDKLDENESVIA